MIIEEFQPLTPVRQLSIEGHSASTVAAEPSGIAFKLKQYYLECAEDASSPGNQPLVMLSDVQTFLSVIRTICWEPRSFSI